MLTHKLKSKTDHLPDGKGHPFDMGKDPSATRTEILRTAERLFALHGIDGPTMRQITADSGTSLNAVNYHFGSKLGLTYAVFDAMAREVSENRTAELNALKTAAGDKPVPLEAIVRATLRPYLEGERSRRLLLIRLIQQHRFSPSPLTQRIVATHFDPIAELVAGMLRRAVPHLSMRDIYWRYSFMVGTTIAIAFDVEPNSRLARLSHGLADPAREGELAEQTIAFIVAGLEGPPTRQRRTGVKRPGKRAKRNRRSS